MMSILSAFRNSSNLSRNTLHNKTSSERTQDGLISFVAMLSLDIAANTRSLIGQSCLSLLLDGGNVRAAFRISNKGFGRSISLFLNYSPLNACRDCQQLE